MTGAAPHLPLGFLERPANDGPAVSIVTVVLNGAATIRRALESVARQTALDAVEHVVLDGGSTDGTIGVVRRASHAPRLVVGHDHGIYDALNAGLAAARGEWIAFLHADDEYAHPRVIEALLAAAARHPEVDAFHADLDWVDDDGQVVKRGRFAPADYGRFHRELPLFHPTVFSRRRLFARVGGFDPSYRVAGDYDLLLRAWQAGVTFRHLPEVFVRMRTGGLSERDRLLSDLEVVRAWRRRAGGRLGAAALRLLRIALDHALERRAPAARAALRGWRG